MSTQLSFQSQNYFVQRQPMDVYDDGTVSRDFTYVETVLDVAMELVTETFKLDF